MKTTAVQRPVPRVGPVSTPTHGTHSVFLHHRRQPLPPNKHQQPLARRQPPPQQQPPQSPFRLPLLPQQLPAVPRPCLERHSTRHSPSTELATASDLLTVRPTPRPAASSPPQASRQLSLRTCTGPDQVPELVQPVAPAGSWSARLTRVATHCRTPVQASS